MVKRQCLFGTLLTTKVPGRHFLFPESWRKGVEMVEANRQSGENEERIIEIEIERLRPFKEYPFQVKDDSSILLYLFSILLLVVQSLLPVYVLSIPTEFLISYL